MIRIKLTIDSVTLQMPVNVDICIPYPCFAQKKQVSVVWLLHCAFKDGSFFLNELGVGKYVDKNNLILVAPSMGNSFYADTDYGDYASFLQKELQPYLLEQFNFPKEREQNHVVGISMGAFGGIIWALNNPELFSKQFLISGTYDPLLPIDERIRKDRALKNLSRITNKIQQILFKEKDVLLPECDIRSKFLNLESDYFPEVHFYCGSEDYMSLNQTHMLEKLLKEKNIPVFSSQYSGAHDTLFWEKCMEDIFNNILNK